MQLGFIGTGEITSSIVTGLSSSGVAAHSVKLMDFSEIGFGADCL